MSILKQGWLPSRFARLSTGLKMLLFLSLALFPLGVVAILASVESARQNDASRAEETLTRLEIKAQRISAALSRNVIAIRYSSAAIALTPPGSKVCESTLERLRDVQLPARYALYADGRLRCATAAYAPSLFSPSAGREGLAVELGEDGSVLRFAVFGDRGQIEGIGEFSRDALANLTYLPGTSLNFDLELRQGTRRMLLRDTYVPGPLIQEVRGSRPIADGALRLDIALGAPPISAAELLLSLLPVLMWLAAGLIGWLIADRLLSRPLTRMQRAVAAYRPGDRHLDLPTIATPAREIGELGLAFNTLTRTVARHEAELEAAIERQTRLVREVHHRVKNNLQVVASLLNLHARGAASDEVAAAYASIQRRVDALAVVHRNHFAELEENKGVAIKALVSELGANLRATAPASAAQITMTLDIEPHYVTQDVAVSVAFLTTEIVEFAMLCGGASVAISLREESGSSARLAFVSPSLCGGVICDEKLFERFDRIVTGLSRQLRSALERDLERGRYALDIAVIVRTEV